MSELTRRFESAVETSALCLASPFHKHVKPSESDDFSFLLFTRDNPLRQKQCFLVKRVKFLAVTQCKIQRKSVFVEGKKYFSNELCGMNFNENLFRRFKCRNAKKNLTQISNLPFKMP